eukprot:gene40501-28131_t
MHVRAVHMRVMHMVLHGGGTRKAARAAASHGCLVLAHLPPPVGVPE